MQRIFDEDSSLVAELYRQCELVKNFWYQNDKQFLRLTPYLGRYTSHGIYGEQNETKQTRLLLPESGHFKISLTGSPLIMNWGRQEVESRQKKETHFNPRA